MAGSLIKIDEEIVSSAVASVNLTGIDSTYDVYMVTYSNFTTDTDSSFVRMRFTVSGVADDSSNYDIANERFQADSGFSSQGATNQGQVTLNSIGTGTQEVSNATIYLFNFNNSSEYSFCTFETLARNTDGNLRGRQGGAVLTEAQTTDGVNFFQTSGNITAGQFTLYGLKK